MMTHHRTHEGGLFLLSTKKYILFISLLTVSLNLLAQPTISSFSPTSGPVGTTVTIIGNNFSPIPNNNIVFFGAVKANVTASTSTSLTVTVPLGSTHQPITVTVDNLTAYSSRPFNVTFAGGVLTSASFTYEDELDGQADVETNDMASGDFDGDGKNDIAVADRINGYMAVYKNNSTVSSFSFASSINYPTSNQPRAIASGDFDGDGKLDVVVANTNANTVSVYRNTSVNGTISFASKIDFATAVQPLDVAVADFDGDGRTDIATANGEVLPSFISILRNTSSPGNISFAAKTDIQILLPVSSIAVGDLNSDKKPDIAVVSAAGNLMTVLTNNSSLGTISFPAITNYATGTTPGGIAIGDIDGDNKPEVVYANFLGGTISIYRNTSSGNTITILHAFNIDVAGADNVTMADADGDGKTDVLVQTFSPSGFSILKNNSSPGAISLESPEHYPASCSDGILIGDWNGDGKNDVIIGCGVFRAAIWKNRTTEPQITSFTPVTSGPGNTITIRGANFTGVTAVTFGGKPAASFTIVNSTTIHAVISTGSTGHVTVTAPHGVGKRAGYVFVPSPVIYSFSPTTGVAGHTITISGNNFTNASSVKFGGVPASSFTVVNATTIKAILGSGASGDVSVTTVGGTATKAGFLYVPKPTITSFSPTTATIGTTVTITGINLDGVTEVRFGGAPPESFTVVSPTTIRAVIMGGSSGGVTVKAPGGMDTLSGFVFISPPAPVVNSIQPKAGPVGIAVTITGINFNAVPALNHVYFGPVKATVSAATTTTLTVIVPVGATFGPVSVTNNLLTAYSPQPFVVTFPNGGGISAESFEGPKTFFTGRAPMETCLSDLDGDGKSDLISANNFSRDISVLKNTSTAGNISFAPKLDFPAYSGSWEILSAEVDGDGKKDILVTSHSRAAISVFRNTSTTGTINFDPYWVYTLAEEPWDIAAADFDQDGKTDFVTANSSTLSVVRNTSVVNSISFSPSIDYDTPSSSSTVKTGDLDGDLKPDIVYFSRYTDTVWVMRNTSVSGVISFAQPVPFPSLAETNYFGFGEVGVGDMDNDGKLDIVVSNASASRSVSILKNNSVPGTISFPSRTDVKTSILEPAFLTIEDLDGDGRLDIAFIHDYVPQTIAVIKNISAPGNLVFKEHVSYSDNVNGQYSLVTAGDLDGDGKPELITCSSNSAPGNGVFIFKNKTDGPHINSFTPGNGITGTTITITGLNFTNASAVSFGGTPATSFTVVSPTTITAVIGNGTSGEISVETPLGTTSAPSFLYGLLPNITSFTPTSGVPGATVTITGNNFTDATNVSFGGVRASSFTVNSSTSITAKVSSGASGEVSVTGPGGTATLPGFTFIPPPPVINTFSPQSGATGTTVTIYGTNFKGVSAVSFGGVPALSFNESGSFQIFARIGAGASGSVTVTTPDGTASKAEFTYISSPALTSFAPTSAGEGASITITGANLEGVTAVSFGGVPAKSFQVNSSTSITALVGAGASGNVSISTSAGIVTLAGFKFIPQPTMLLFTPASGKTGTAVTIHGTNFTAATSVTFGGTEAASFTINSATRITAIVGPGASGDVSVTTPGGIAKLSGFTFIALPVITSFTPSSAKTGETVTITGSNFSNATAVSFGGVAVTSFTINSATSITAVVGTGASGEVKVVTADGTATLPGFTFNVVTAIDPVPVGSLGIRFYPNPTTGAFTIDSLRLTDKWETLEIFNASGNQAFLTRKISGRTQITLDISSLPSGLFMALLRRKNGSTAIMKFLKL